MAGGSDIRAGKAFVEIAVNKSALVKGLKGIKGELQAWGAGISSMGRSLVMAGGAVTAPLLAAVHSWASSGAEMVRMSQRTGVAVESLSALKYVAGQSGVEFEGMEGSIRKMQKAIYAAQSGKGAGPAFLRGLGGKGADEQLGAIADKLNAIPDPTKRAAVAMQIFGRAGTQMLPMLSKGSAGLKAMRQEAVELGLIKTKESAAAALAMTQAWHKLTMVFGAVKNAIGGALGPMLTGLANAVAKMGKSAIDWINANKPLIVQIFQLGTVAVAAGTGLLILGKTLVFAGSVFGTIAGGITFFAHTLDVAAAVVGFLLSPLGLLTAAVVGLGGYFLYSSGVAGKAIGYIKGIFASLLSDVQSTMGVIADSLAAGDIGSAVKVGWAFIKMEWQRGVNFITGLWEGYKFIWDEALTYLVVDWIDFTAKVQSVFADLVNWLSKKWDEWGTSNFEEKIASWLVPLFAKMEGVSSEDAQKELAYNMDVSRRTRPARFAAMDKETADKKAAIEEERHIGAQSRFAGLGERNKKRSQDMADAQAAVDAARKEWEDAKTEAQQKAANKKQQQAEEPVPGMGDVNLGGAGPTRGTFSAAAAPGMAMGTTMERVAKSTEKMTKQQQQILDVLKRAGLGMAP